MDTLDYIPSLEIKELEPIESEQVTIYTVKVTHPSLRMRKGPSLSAEVAGLITDEGIYDIVDENNGWGKLKNGNWIMLTYTKVVEI